MAKGLVLEQIAIERSRQDEQWGGAEHDDNHSLPVWWSFLEKHWVKFGNAFVGLQDAEDDAAEGHPLGESGPVDARAFRTLRHRAIVVAALMVALVESCDRTYARTSTGQEER